MLITADGEMNLGKVNILSNNQESDNKRKTKMEMYQAGEFGILKGGSDLNKTASSVFEIGHKGNISRALPLMSNKTEKRPVF
jgi:hypothetical protein